MLRFSDEVHIVGCSICLCRVASSADRAALEGLAPLNGMLVKPAGRAALALLSALEQGLVHLVSERNEQGR